MSQKKKLMVYVWKTVCMHKSSWYLLELGSADVTLTFGKKKGPNEWLENVNMIQGFNFVYKHQRLQKAIKYWNILTDIMCGRYIWNEWDKVKINDPLRWGFSSPL